jgi:hypothetical protein
MLKVITLIFAAVIVCTALGTWAAANSHNQRQSHGNASSAAAKPIDPLALMKATSSNLPHQQYDAF